MGANPEKRESVVTGIKDTTSAKAGRVRGKSLLSRAVAAIGALLLVLFVVYAVGDTMLSYFGVTAWMRTAWRWHAAEIERATPELV